MPCFRRGLILPLPCSLATRLLLLSAIIFFGNPSQGAGVISRAVHLTRSVPGHDGAPDPKKTKPIQADNVYLEGGNPEIAAVLQFAFKRNPDIEPSPEFQRLNGILKAETQRLLSQMTPTKRANFIKIIEDVQPGLRVSQDLGQDVHSLGNTSAHIYLDAKTGLGLAVDIIAQDHPLGLLTQKHEESHLSRLVSEATTPQEMMAHVQELNHRKFALYREELRAFRDEYRYLRKAYTEADLPRLHETMRGPDAADLELLKQKGVIKQPDGPDGKVIIDLNLAVGSGQEILDGFRRYMTGNMNKIYIENVESALSQSESQYIKNCIHQSYRERQKNIHVDEAIQRALRYADWGLGLSLGAVAAGGVYFLLEKKRANP